MSEYHTALGTNKKARNWQPVSNHVGKNGLAFQHDIFNGMPESMSTADVFYTDLPWQQGFPKFAELAGTAQVGSYIDFLVLISDLMKAISKPVCIITSKHSVKYLNPLNVSLAKLNTAENVVACLWNMDGWEGHKDAVEILNEFADKYDVVGDFCCGNGRAGRIFSEHGKKYIMSDFDARCIGYIAQNEAEWGNGTRSF